MRWPWVHYADIVYPITSTCMDYAEDVDEQLIWVALVDWWGTSG